MKTLARVLVIIVLVPLLVLGFPLVMGILGVCLSALGAFAIVCVLIALAFVAIDGSEESEDRP